MVTTLMSGSAIISEFLKEDVKKELKELEESKKKEEKITENFNKSMRKLSFLL